MSDLTGKLFVIAGPSCVGKTPLLHALQRHRPDLADPLGSVVLYNDRPPRPGETDGVDYHFRTTEQIERLRDEPDRYIVMQVRDDLQALDLDELREQLRSKDVLFEGNPFVGELLAGDDRLDDLDRRSMFVSPFSTDELRALSQAGADLNEAVTTVMRAKLERRTRALQGELDQAARDDIETRAGSAFGELQRAGRFDWVIANHDGEDSEHWTLLAEPIGEARRTLGALVEMLEGRKPAAAEAWTAEVGAMFD